MEGYWWSFIELSLLKDCHLRIKAKIYRQVFAQQLTAKSTIGVYVNGFRLEVSAPFMTDCSSTFHQDRSL